MCEKNACFLMLLQLRKLQKRERKVIPNYGYVASGLYSCFDFDGSSFSLRSVHAVKENAEAVVVTTKENGLEVNADKTKYMVMSRDRNAGRVTV